MFFYLKLFLVRQCVDGIILYRYLTDDVKVDIEMLNITKGTNNNRSVNPENTQDFHFVRLPRNIRQSG
jgi:hypothetical protein